MTDIVRVTAADYNGDSWDGCPFDRTPAWLFAAVEDKTIDIKPDDRDYALWSVLTPQGRVIAEPDDSIERLSDGSFMVHKFVAHPKPSSDRMAVGE